MTDHLDKWSAYSRARLLHEQAKQAASNAYAEMKKTEGELVDAMLEDEVANWTDATGANVSLRKQFTISCNAENSQNVEEWLQDRFGDAEQYKKTSLDKFAVLAVVRKLCDEEGETPESLPEFLNVSTRPTITVRGWEKKKTELLK